MRRPSMRRMWTVGVVLVLGLGLGACGVTAQDEPVDLGDAYAPASRADSAPVAPPQPNAATQGQLVEDFLDAATGGGEAAVAQISTFLTKKARAAWQPPDKDSPGITIVHVLDQPIAGAPRPSDLAAPVPVKYQVVGVLNDEGRVVFAGGPHRTHTMTYWVVRAPGQSSQWRIDEIDGAPPGLLLRDEALNNRYYRQQPIYFWDTGNKVLIPDLRYVPLTAAPDYRANLILRWLIRGPSPLLVGAVNRLPFDTAPTPGVVSLNSTLVVRLTPQAGQGPAEQRRLMYQLQLSMRPSTRGDIELWLGNTKAPSVGPSDYQHFDLSYGLPSARLSKFDIVDGQVRPSPGDGGPAPAPSVLDAKENRNVEFAAINRDATLAAFVRRVGGTRTLVIAREGGPTRTARLPARPEIGRPRPVWIPGTSTLLIVWGGALYHVTADGNASLVATPGLGTITSVAISPDGRRLALIAEGRVRVAPLMLSGAVPTVAVGGQSQEIVTDPRLVPAGVAWESELQLYVAGHVEVGAGAQRPALWLVTADGVVAADRSAILLDVVPTDVVAYPRGSLSSTGEAVVQSASNGPYRLTEVSITLDVGPKYPFFIT